MEAGETVSKLADEVGISRHRLYEWRDHLRLHGNLKSLRRGRPGRSTAGRAGPFAERGRRAGTSGKGTDKGQAPDQGIGAESRATAARSPCDREPCGTWRKHRQSSAPGETGSSRSSKRTTAPAQGEFNIDRCGGHLMLKASRWIALQ